jgi:hypothetical protein
MTAYYKYLIIFPHNYKAWVIYYISVPILYSLEKNFIVWHIFEIIVQIGLEA